MNCDRVFAGAALLILAGSSMRVFAAGPTVRPTHEFLLGATRQAASSRALATSASLPAVSVELEDLNVDDDYDSWFAQYNWRFRERWQLGLFAYQYRDSGRTIVSEEFNYDGVEFNAGVLIDAALEIDTYALDLMYALHQGPRSELLIGGGIHALDMSASFVGRALVDDASETFAAASDSLLAPVPNLRAQGIYAFDDRFSVDLTVGWLSANVDAYDGHFAYAHARLRCRIGDNSAVSLGYQFTSADVIREADTNRKQQFDVELHGPSLQLIFGF